MISTKSIYDKKMSLTSLVAIVATAIMVTSAIAIMSNDINADTASNSGDNSDGAFIIKYIEDPVDLPTSCNWDPENKVLKLTNADLYAIEFMRAGAEDETHHLVHEVKIIVIGDCKVTCGDLNDRKGIILPETASIEGSGSLTITGFTDGIYQPDTVQSTNLSLSISINKLIIDTDFRIKPASQKIFNGIYQYSSSTMSLVISDLKELSITSTDVWYGRGIAQMTGFEMPRVDATMKIKNVDSFTVDITANTELIASDDQISSGIYQYAIAPQLELRDIGNIEMTLKDVVSKTSGIYQCSIMTYSKIIADSFIADGIGSFSIEIKINDKAVSDYVEICGIEQIGVNKLIDFNGIGSLQIKISNSCEFRIVTAIRQYGDDSKIDSYSTLNLNDVDKVYLFVSWEDQALFDGITDVIYQGMKEYQYQPPEPQPQPIPPAVIGRSYNTISFDNVGAFGIEMSTFKGTIEEEENVFQIYGIRQIGCQNLINVENGTEFSIKMTNVNNPNVFAGIYQRGNDYVSKCENKIQICGVDKIIVYSEFDKNWAYSGNETGMFYQVGVLNEFSIEGVNSVDMKFVNSPINISGILQISESEDAEAYITFSSIKDVSVNIGIAYKGGENVEYVGAIGQNSIEAKMLFSDIDSMKINIGQSVVGGPKYIVMGIFQYTGGFFATGNYLNNNMVFNNVKDMRITCSNDASAARAICQKYSLGSAGYYNTNITISNSDSVSLMAKGATSAVGIYQMDPLLTGYSKGTVSFKNISQVKISLSSVTPSNASNSYYGVQASGVVLEDSRISIDGAVYGMDVFNSIVLRNAGFAFVPCEWATGNIYAMKTNVGAIYCDSSPEGDGVKCFNDKSATEEAPFKSGVTKVITTDIDTHMNMGKYVAPNSDLIYMIIIGFTFVVALGGCFCYYWYFVRKP